MTSQNNKNYEAKMKTSTYDIFKRDAIIVWGQELCKKFRQPNSKVFRIYSKLLSISKDSLNYSKDTLKAVWQIKCFKPASCIFNIHYLKWLEIIYLSTLKINYGVSRDVSSLLETQRKHQTHALCLITHGMYRWGNEIFE